jgi:glutamate 5-kinase
MAKVRYRKITLKVGSNVLTGSDGMLNESRIGHLVEQIASLKKQGVEVLFVSSGAVASGRKIVEHPKRHDTISCRQLWASIGQVRLIQLYNELFAKHGLLCSQILVTKEDFRDRRHFLNMRNCLETVLENGVVPIINENDVVSVNELMFTDNDELAGLITNMMDTDALILLSNIDGIYDGDPSDPVSQLIPVVNPDMYHVSKYITTKKSDFGRGGMITKFSIAKKIAAGGTPVHMADGTRDFILTDLVEDKPGTPQTLFTPLRKSSSVKKWLALNDASIKGKIYINEGAERSLCSHKAVSLLPVGVTRIEGEFMKGDIVGIFNPDGELIGMGKSEYNSDTAIKKIGEKNSKPVIHYDYLYLKNP